MNESNFINDECGMAAVEYVLIAGCVIGMGLTVEMTGLLDMLKDQFEIILTLISAP